MSYFIIEENRHLTQRKERVLNYLGEVLPHGSGIDTDWLIKMTSPSRVRCSAAYHCMNEVGMYDGYVEFSVLIDINDTEYFRLMFHFTTQAKAEKYGLREALTDEICECLQHAFGDGPLHPPEDYQFEKNEI